MKFLAIAASAALTLCIASSSVRAAGKVGSLVEEFEVADYHGQSRTLSEFNSSRLIVVAFLGTECPLAKLYSGRLQSLSEKYADRNVTVLGVMSNVQDSVTEIDAFVRRQGITFPMLKDTGNHLADQLGAERTPEVYLLDRARSIRYRGRIDDQYGVGVIRDEPEQRELENAIEEVLASKSVSHPQTAATGCIIGRAREVDESSPVTYSKDIARIFQSHCVECHREGEIAPFTLTSYDDVVGWGEMIAEVVRERRMPPWHANPEFGEFANDCSLSEEDQQKIFTWVEHGCPEGDATEAPAPREYVEGWQLSREPEVIYAMRDEPFTVPADAGPEGVAYQNFWIDPGITEEKWVREAEVVPGNRAVVHHIIVYVHPNGKDSREEIFLTAYVPGLRLEGMPAGAAKKIPANSWFRFQVHYTPIGHEEQDLSSVGLVFANPDDVQYEVLTTEVHNSRFEIKPNEDRQRVEASSHSSPTQVQLLSMSPHMHLRGQAFRYELERPDGTTETLLDVPRYDFNWQTRYTLAEPMTIPAKSIVRCTAWYDNTSSNLANPDPDATIHWGDQSWDEMMIGYMDVMFPVRKKP